MKITHNIGNVTSNIGAPGIARVKMKEEGEASLMNRNKKKVKTIC